MNSQSDISGKISQGETSQGEISPNIGLDLARATEAAALAAGRWAGLGRPIEAERAGAEAMSRVLQRIEVDGVVCLGEADRLGQGVAFTTGTARGHGPRRGGRCAGEAA